ncbi:MAG: ATP-binding protein [Cyanobacteria bacterium J06623_5]
MANHPRSFRRNLLLRILAFSLPILFIGQAVALRKARTSLLTTARQNLTSSAIRKAEELETGIQSVKANLDLLAETEAFQSGDVDAIRKILTEFIQEATPYTINCVELKSPKSKESAINTCQTSNPTPEISTSDAATSRLDTLRPDNLRPNTLRPDNLRHIVPTAKQVPWLQTGSVEKSDFYVFSPGLSATVVSNTRTDIPEGRALVQFVVASPVYAQDGTLRYTLAMEVYLYQLQDIAPQSLVGETVVIDQNQVIVTHPDSNQIGQNIADLRDANKLNSVIGNVKAGNDDFVHLYGFLPEDGREWLAGYSGFQVPVSPKQNRVWTVLAVTPIEKALDGLNDIRQVLFVLNVGLFIASILLALYVSRSLSLPIERLIRYTQDVDDLSQLKEAPHSSHIWELDYLGTVIERMLRRLEENSAELRRAWQDAQMANQLKNEFLANTSHELRTPLNGIIGSIHLVQDDLCDSREEELEFLHQADKAALHLLSVIEDILNIAKIEAGTLDVNITPVDLRHILQDVLEIQTSQIQEKGLKVIRPDFPEPIVIPVDHSRFKQVLLNVLSNAIKFTDEGTISIKVTTDESLSDEALSRAEIYMPPPPWVKIAITDSGIGIAPKHLPKLFKPFVMIDGSHTRPYGGTGLGLAISQNFMHLMQGDITIYSEGPGQGTTVTIVVPRLGKENQLNVGTAPGATESSMGIDKTYDIAHAIASDVGVASENGLSGNQPASVSSGQ